MQGGVCDFYPFNDLISPSQTPPCHASSFPLLAQHDLSLFRPTGFRKPTPQTWPYLGFFFLLLPPWEGVSELLGLGRGGGGGSGGLRLSPWRPESKQSWAGRGWGCTFPVNCSRWGRTRGWMRVTTRAARRDTAALSALVRTIVLKLGLQSLLRLIISRSSPLCFQLKFSASEALNRSRTVCESPELINGTQQRRIDSCYVKKTKTPE